MNKNAKFGVSLVMLVAGMVMLAYASVPLYKMFCQVTGFGGTTMRADSAPDKIYDRVIKVRFNSDTDPNLAWNFKPEVNEVTVKVGENKLAFFTAENLSNVELTGTATYNVTPLKAGGYFSKIQCFCFNQQTIKPGERIEFPVSFFVNPEIMNDRDLDDVTTITLSYTFFKVKDEDKNLKTSEVVKDGKKASKL